MNELMGMRPLGWLASAAIGFVIGGLFFLTIKLQVQYVVEQKGPLWVMPAALYARLVLVAIVLVLTAVLLPGRQIAAAMLAGTAGALLARVLVSRMVRSGDKGPKEE